MILYMGLAFTCAKCGTISFVFTDKVQVLITAVLYIKLCIFIPMFVCRRL